MLTYPFISEERLDDLRIGADDVRRKLVRLANPIAEDQPYLRSNLIATLVDAARVNIGRGMGDLAIYEIGKAYRAEGKGKAGLPGIEDRPSDKELAALNAALPFEELRVAGLLAGARVPAGWQGAAQPFEWSDAIAAALGVIDEARVQVTVEADPHAPWHPGRVATFRLADGTFVGHAGELHPKVCETLGLPARSCVFELSLDVLVRASEGASVRAVPVLTQPLAKEDFAFVVDAALPAGVAGRHGARRRWRPAGGRARVRRVRGRAGGRWQEVARGEREAACRGPDAGRRGDPGRAQGDHRWRGEGPRRGAALTGARCRGGESLIQGWIQDHARRHLFEDGDAGCDSRVLVPCQRRTPVCGPVAGRSGADAAE